MGKPPVPCDRNCGRDPLKLKVSYTLELIAGRASYSWTFAGFFFFWLCLFCGWVFHKKVPFCGCLMASGVGMVGYFLTLQCDQYFRKMKMFLTKPYSIPEIWAPRASTSLVWLLVVFYGRFPCRNCGWLSAGFHTYSRKCSSCWLLISPVSSFILQRMVMKWLSGNRHGGGMSSRGGLNQKIFIQCSPRPKNRRNSVCERWRSNHTLAKCVLRFLSARTKVVWIHSIIKRECWFAKRILFSSRPPNKWPWSIQNVFAERKTWSWTKPGIEPDPAPRDTQHPSLWERTQMTERAVRFNIVFTRRK